MHSAQNGQSNLQINTKHSCIEFSNNILMLKYVYWITELFDIIPYGFFKSLQSFLPVPLVEEPLHLPVWPLGCPSGWKLSEFGRRHGVCRAVASGWLSCAVASAE